MKQIEGKVDSDLLAFNKEDKMIVLASGSPRRREILKEAGIKFDIITADVDETIDPNIPSYLMVQELAAKKAVEASKKCDDDSVIIGADTVVCIDDIILGKPADENDAFNMLKKLSGREHEVLTGVAIIRNKDSFMVTFYEKTKVLFKNLTDDVIWEYIRTGEPMDKAGAYGIQGVGGSLIEEISGDYKNVVGLPINRLVECLIKEFEIYG